MFARSAIIGQHFAFAYGRTGVLQQNLLTQSDIDRLLGAHDRQEADRILTELKFTQLINQSLGKHEAILQALAAWVRTEVLSMSPADQADIFDILWLEEDAALLAFLLKEYHGLSSDISQPPRPALSAWHPDDLRRLVQEDVANNMPDALIRFAREQKMTERPVARAIDTAVARFTASLRIARANKSRSTTIRRYVKHEIDSMNIRTALRLADSANEEVRPLLVEGGTIPPQELTGSLSSIAAAVRKSGISYRLADLLERTPDDVNAIERLLRDVSAEDISNMWNLPLRIEPIFAFAATALAQLRFLRVLFIGKRADMPPQELKRALPPFLSSTHYV